MLGLHFPELLVNKTLLVSPRLDVRWVHSRCIKVVMLCAHENSPSIIYSPSWDVAPDDVVVDCTFASQMKRVMRSINFANFQVEWLVRKCHSFAFLRGSEVARFELWRNVVLVVKPHGKVPFRRKRCKWSLKISRFKNVHAADALQQKPEAWSVFSRKLQCFLWRSCEWCFDEEHGIGSLKSDVRFQTHRSQQRENSIFQEFFRDLSNKQLFWFWCGQKSIGWLQFHTFWIQINRQCNHIEETFVQSVKIIRHLCVVNILDSILLLTLQIPRHWASLQLFLTLRSWA